MVKTYGAVDRRHRKRRSDAGRKRRSYRGKPVKKKRDILWQKRIGDKQTLKLWVWEKGTMSRDGRSKWNRRIRPFIKPIVYRFRMRIDADISYLTTKEKIEQFLLDIIEYDGEFLLMGFSNAKNRFHTKPVKICRVVIFNSREGLRARMIQDYRLWRYWFYKGD